MSRVGTKPSRRQVLVEEVHEAGLRATRARIAVLDTLSVAAAPLTHHEVVAKLEGGQWDAATIYRNLIALVEAGLVTRSDHGDHRWRYERPSKGKHAHPHFLCSDCGGVRCLPGTQVVLRGKPALPRSAREGHFEVQLQGVCDLCLSG